MQVRRVRRIIRKIDPWTVLKASLIFNVISGLVFLLGMWVMWSIAVQRGIPAGIADIFESLTLTITPDGELYFRAIMLLTVIMVVVATAAMTLGAVLYNLISDLVGGIEVTVLEESYLPAPQSRRVLRPVTQRAQAAVPVTARPAAPQREPGRAAAQYDGAVAQRDGVSAAAESPGKVSAPTSS